MKSKEITEGFFKGLAKGMGYKDVPSASDAEIDGAVMNTPSTGGGGINIPNQPQYKKGKFEIVVDEPKKPLTVRMDGQLYTLQSGKNGGWLNTKSGKDVNPNFANVLDSQYDQYIEFMKQDEPQYDLTSLSKETGMKLT
jgi:hypothetical protein